MCRVLIVEDNVDAAASMQWLVDFWGHDVYVARDGAAGLNQALELRPDVVLADIGLPRMDGYALARALRRELPRAFLVAITGYASPADRAMALEAGFDYHLSKPANPATLEHLISTAGH